MKQESGPQAPKKLKNTVPPSAPDRKPAGPPPKTDLKRAMGNGG